MTEIKGKYEIEMHVPRAEGTSYGAQVLRYRHTEDNATFNVPQNEDDRAIVQAVKDLTRKVFPMGTLKITLEEKQ